MPNFPQVQQIKIFFDFKNVFSIPKITLKSHEILRAFFLLFIISTYTVLVFYRCTGTATLNDLTWFFLFNFYFFGPLLMISRTSADPYNFFALIQKDDSSSHLNTLLSFIFYIIILILAFAFLSPDIISNNNPNIRNTKIALLAMLSIFMFGKIVISWHSINLQAFNLFITGNLFEKIASFLSYTLMISFLTLSFDAPYHSNIPALIVISAFIIFLFSPLVGIYLFNKTNSEPAPRNKNAYTYTSPSNQLNISELAIFYTIGSVVFQFFSQIFFIKFFITFTKTEIMWFTILFSSPNMYLILIIIFSIFIPNKKYNIAVATLILFLFYSAVLLISYYF